MEKSSREILSDNNISITNPRIIVLEQLLKYKKPISVDSLLSSLNNQVATSTLYRVLNDLKKINVVSEFITPENTTMIELSLHEDEHHHHLFCKSCGDVIDIEYYSSKKTNKCSVHSCQDEYCKVSLLLNNHLESNKDLIISKTQEDGIINMFKHIE